MSTIMHLNTLLAIDTAMTLYMGKVMGSPNDPKLFPTPQTLHSLTFKLLSKAERNFVAKEVDDNGVWAPVPAGKGSIWNLEDTLAIANYCTENMDKIQVPNANALAYAYQAVIKSRESTKGDPKKLCAIHVIPALMEGEHISDYPAEVLGWVDRRFQYVMPPVLKFLKEAGVPCALAQDITLAEWEELVNAEFATMDEKSKEPTEDKGGELMSFSEMSPAEVEVDLMATGGDEHVSLFASDFNGTYYLQDDEHVANAESAQKVLKGYWDIFGTCESEHDADIARQDFLKEVREGINEFKDRMADQNTGAGIVILD